MKALGGAFVSGVYTFWGACADYAGFMRGYGHSKRKLREPLFKYSFKNYVIKLVI